MADSKASSLDPIGSIDRATDKVYLIDVSAGTSNANTINSMLGITGTSLGTTDTQSVTNKTFDNSNIFTVRDDRFTIQDNSDTTKQAVFQASGITTATTRTYTLPDRSSTLATLGGNQTFSGVITATGAVLNGATIANPTLTVDAINEYTSANGVNIDGLVIKDALLPAGNIQPLNLVAGTGSSWVSQSYSPTWTNVTVGNGTVAAKYSQTGKQIDAYIQLTFGSTTAITGVPQVSLPVTSVSYHNYSHILGFGGCYDVSTATAYPGLSSWVSTTAIEIDITNTASTYTTTTAISSTAPMTWATGDVLTARIRYEAA